MNCLEDDDISDTVWKKFPRSILESEQVQALYLLSATFLVFRVTVICGWVFGFFSCTENFPMNKSVEMGGYDGGAGDMCTMNNEVREAQGKSAQLASEGKGMFESNKKTHF